ncbi:MAG: hypothetical protein KDD51_08825 [Bdellovibrionales bacterium]|nr:hypothetical protein [Bdellovibrionales bacterium]
MRRRFVVMLKNVALVAIVCFSLFSAPAEAGVFDWLANLCGYAVSEEAGETPANPIPAFLQPAFAAVAKLENTQALKAARLVDPAFDPTHGPSYTNPTPERVSAWRGLLGLTTLGADDRVSAYDAYLDKAGEAGLMDGEDVDLYLHWLVAAGVYLRELGKDTKLVFQHAFALGVDYLAFVRSLPPDVALLYIQGDPNYTSASVETYLADLTEAYREWGEIFRKLIELHGAQPSARPAVEAEAAAERQSN